MDDLEWPDYDSRRDREDKAGLPIWPWLVVLGLLIIAIGAIGPLLAG
jgi:hypothetical protein